MAHGKYGGKQMTKGERKDYKPGRAAASKSYKMGGKQMTKYRGKTRSKSRY